jgi:hypothetical protein
MSSLKGVPTPVKNDGNPILMGSAGAAEAENTQGNRPTNDKQATRDKILLQQSIVLITSSLILSPATLDSGTKLVSDSPRSSLRKHPHKPKTFTMHRYPA